MKARRPRRVRHQADGSVSGSGTGTWGQRAAVVRRHHARAHTAPHRHVTGRQLPGDDRFGGDVDELSGRAEPGRELVTAFQQPSDQCKTTQHQPLRLDAKLAWPDYPALTEAKQDAASHLRPLADILDTYARTGNLHEPGHGWIRRPRHLRTHQRRQHRVRRRRPRPHRHRRRPLLPPRPAPAPSRRQHRTHEPPEEATRRECKEETGWRPHILRLRATTHPLASATAATARLYLGTDLHPGSIRSDPTETDMTVRWPSLPEAVRAVETGAICETARALSIALAARTLAPP
ncbi:NUDIX hydrolase [Streptomyces sp. NPDC049585]|uniref:NUDIX hydrolase n=1 Tax=Streptomyces sp. NPDC049585 TaxID=3155154 RepID=UPI00343346EE